MSQTKLVDLPPDKYGERSETEGKKLCTDCKTTKTPLWRIGPYGPKPLCNACGIKYRKNKGGGAVKGLNKESSEKKKEKPSQASSSSSSSSTSTTTATTDCSKKGHDGNTSGVNRGQNGKLGSKMKVRLMGLGIEVVLLKRPRSPIKKRQRSCKKLGEVEQAALLLMAMSCDSVYA